MSSGASRQPLWTTFLPAGSPWAGYLAAIGAVALVSFLIGILAERIHLANLSMLYLVAVLVLAVAYGRGPAIAASVLAVLAFNWFFAEPLHTFAIADPEVWVVLLLFLLVGVVTSQLAADQRRRAAEAHQREREAVVLYDVVRLMGEPDLDQALRAVAERMRQELGLTTVVIELLGGRDSPPARTVVGEDTDSLDVAQRAASGATAWILGEGATPTRGRPAAPGRWVRVVPPRLPDRSGDRARLLRVPVKARGGDVVGSLTLVRPRGTSPLAETDNRLLSTVAAQLGLAYERAQLRREATETEILRRTDDLRRALLNAVSHDLRTPLASIIASAGSLRQRDVAWSVDERAEFTRAIEDEAQRLNRIVGNLLDLSRIQGGTLRPEKAWHDLGALVDDVLGRLRPLTAQHRVTVAADDDLPPVSLDYVEMDQVLSNLVENAVKYSPRGSEIAIAIRRRGERACLEVADWGPGVPADALPRLFDPFYRAQAAATHPRGLGLGLAVAKGLVEAHGGTIQVENRSEGGAVVTVCLPIGQPAVSA